MLKTIYFDIECAGLPRAEQLARFEPTFEADGRLKDPEKIKGNLEAQADAWADKAALDAGRGQILCIGVLGWDGVEVNVWQTPEPDMLKGFWELFEYEAASTFCGHNVIQFDIPFMVRRSFILGVKVPEMLFDGRYLTKRIKDTMAVWAAGTRDMISLDNLARSLNIGKKIGDGKDFGRLWNEDKAKAIEYCKHDIQLTAKCAVKMGIR